MDEEKRIVHGRKEKPWGNGKSMAGIIYLGYRRETLQMSLPEENCQKDGGVAGP